MRFLFSLGVILSFVAFTSVFISMDKFAAAKDRLDNVAHMNMSAMDVLNAIEPGGGH